MHRSRAMPSGVAERAGTVQNIGVKRRGIVWYSNRLNSSDTLAWSYTARRSGQLPGCRHKACDIRPIYALRWRVSILRAVDQPQLELVGDDDPSWRHSA